MKKLEGKTPSQSRIEMRELVMPHHANPRGTIFGGVVMSWVDLAAAMVATRHARSQVVTAHIDSLSFKAPIHVGEHVLIYASMNYVGKTSMEVGVKVWAERPLSGERFHTTSAYLTLIALDKQGRPTPISSLITENPEEKGRWEKAKKRVLHRKSLR